jgi:rRNA maturation RNase YbeY
MGKIRFFNEDITYRLNNKKKIGEWINTIINYENSKILENLNIILCSDQYLLSMNKHYLNHTTLTDVLTFNISNKTEVIDGEVYISVDRVKENGSIFGVSLQNELKRVIIHGVLHLIGYNDQNKEDKKRMKDLEDTYLKLIKE